MAPQEDKIDTWCLVVRCFNLPLCLQADERKMAQGEFLMYLIHAVYLTKNLSKG